MSFVEPSGSPPDPITDLKTQIKQRYLGLFGIHAIGCRRATNTIRIYATPGDERLEPTVEAVRVEIAPVHLELILEAEPRVQVSSN